MCRVLANIRISLFSINSDNANFYKAYENGLFELRIQMHRRKQKMQQTYQASLKMRLSKNHVFKLQEAAEVKKMLTRHQLSPFLESLQFNY